MTTKINELLGQAISLLREAKSIHDEGIEADDNFGFAKEKFFKDIAEYFVSDKENVSPSQSVTRETWLNGWCRRQGGVLTGTTVHCAGCGKVQGITCIALTGDERWPEKMPDWPFDESECPVHNYREEPQPVDRLTERAKALKSRHKSAPYELLDKIP